MCQCILISPHFAAVLKSSGFTFRLRFFFRCIGPFIRCLSPVFLNDFVKFPLSLFANVCCVVYCTFVFFFNNVMHDDVYVTNRSNC